jgi:hypothetical protein
MRPELRDLLLQAGVAAHLPADAWQRIVMLNNTGAVGGACEGGMGAIDRGFHLLILSAEGRPIHYCKCRSARPGGAAHRESAVLQAFSAHRATAGLVPAVQVARNDRVEIQVARFVTGHRLDQLLAAVPEQRLMVLLQQSLDAAGRLSDAARAMPELFPATASPAVYRDAAAEALAALPALGVSAEDRVTLASGLGEAGSVQAHPQHRDYWPANIMIAEDGGCQVLDFDHYGDVAIPLYDRLHFLRTAWDQLRGREGGLWLEWLCTVDPLSARMRRLIADEAERLALTPAQLGGCLLFYLIDAAAIVHLRGGPEAFWRDRRNELPAAARLLRHHGSVAEFGAAILSPAPGSTRRPPPW